MYIFYFLLDFLILPIVPKYVPYLGLKSVALASQTASKRISKKNRACVSNTFIVTQNQPRFQFSREFASVIQ